MGLLANVNIHDTWREFVSRDETIQQLNLIEGKIGNNYTPDKDLVLRFLELDINSLKVVILGQDPYKPAGVANGRAFQPNDLESWSDKFRQISLKNIIRNIYRSVNNINNYWEIPSYSDIINSGFGIKQPRDWFDSIESQGVLLLNTALTCEIGKSNSHKVIWEKFSWSCIEYLASHNKNLYWFLWGKEAQNYKYIIGNYADKSRIYESRHPMMCSESYSDDFIKNNCFKDTMDIINWLG